MRQYWRDLESLERWTRSEPHRQWWQQFLRDAGGTGFWHEMYLMSGGMEAVYDDMPVLGMSRFAPLRPARGAQFSSRKRLGRNEKAVPIPVVSEADYYAASGEGQSASS